MRLFTIKEWENWDMYWKALIRALVSIFVCSDENLILLMSDSRRFNRKLWITKPIAVHYEHHCGNFCLSRIAPWPVSLFCEFPNFCLYDIAEGITKLFWIFSFQMFNYMLVMLSMWYQLREVAFRKLFSGVMTFILNDLSVKQRRLPLIRETCW